MRCAEELQDTRCCGRCKASPGICGHQWHCPCHRKALAAARAKAEARAYQAELVRVWGSDGMGRG